MMSEYRAPTDDMLFVLEHIADLSELANRAGYEHADLETVEGFRRSRTLHGRTARPVEPQGRRRGSGG